MPTAWAARATQAAVAVAAALTVAAAAHPPAPRRRPAWTRSQSPAATAALRAAGSPRARARRVRRGGSRGCASGRPRPHAPLLGERAHLRRRGVHERDDLALRRRRPPVSAPRTLRRPHTGALLLGAPRLELGKLAHLALAHGVGSGAKRLARHQRLFFISAARAASAASSRACAAARAWVRSSAATASVASSAAASAASTASASSSRAAHAAACVSHAFAVAAARARHTPPGSPSA